MLGKKGSKLLLIQISCGYYINIGRTDSLCFRFHKTGVTQLREKESKDNYYQLAVNMAVEKDKPS